MHSEGYYPKVKDLMSKEEFSRAVQELDREFDGLLEISLIKIVIGQHMIK